MIFFPLFRSDNISFGFFDLKVDIWNTGCYETILNSLNLLCDLCTIKIYKNISHLKTQEECHKLRFETFWVHFLQKLKSTSTLSNNSVGNSNWLQPTWNVQNDVNIHSCKYNKGICVFHFQLINYHYFMTRAINIYDLSTKHQQNWFQMTNDIKYLIRIENRNKVKLRELDIQWKWWDLERLHQLWKLKLKNHEQNYFSHNDEITRRRSVLYVLDYIDLHKMLFFKSLHIYF